MSSYLGEKIKKLRKEKKYTLETLATKAKLSKSYLWELENKESQNPSAEKLMAIADALDVTFDYFLEKDLRPASEKEFDDAFFREYKKLEKSDKEKLRNIIKAFN